MLKELLDLLKLPKEDWGMDSKEMRAMMEEHKAEKEAELAQITEAMGELDYMEAMTDSFAGGPEGDPQ